MEAWADHALIVFQLVLFAPAQQGTANQVRHLRTGVQFLGKFAQQACITTEEKIPQLWNDAQVFLERQHLVAYRAPLAHSSGDTLQVAQTLQAHRETTAQRRTF